MAKEPENLVLRMLRDMRGELGEVRKTLNLHTTALARLEKRMDEGFQTSHYALGLAANTHLRHDGIVAEVEALKARVEKLENQS